MTTVYRSAVPYTKPTDDDVYDLVMAVAAHPIEIDALASRLHNIIDRS
jgi:hypothetical protein